MSKHAGEAQLPHYEIPAPPEPDWLDLLPSIDPTTAAIVFSALLAASIAVHSIKTQRAIARRRATLDVILKLESEPDYQKSAATFRDVRDSNSGLAGLIENKSPSQREKEELLHIINFLNHYELIFCGIRRDTLDELFYFIWFQGPVIKHWEQAKDFVVKARERDNDDEICKQFQVFAESWERNVFVVKRSNKSPKWYLDNPDFDGRFQ